MQREAEELGMMTEMSVARGYAMASVPGYAEKRQREIRASQPLQPARPNDGDWARQMAQDFPSAVRQRRASDGPLSKGAQ